MDTNLKGAPRRHPPHALKLWLLSAVLLALAGFLTVEVGSRGAGHEAVAGDARGSGPPGRSVVRLDRDAAIVLPEEYRAVHPAGVDGVSLAIPPSETWPSQ